VLVNSASFLFSDIQATQLHAYLHSQEVQVIYLMSHCFTVAEIASMLNVRRRMTEMSQQASQEWAQPPAAKTR